jgi:tRNA modification GTPase
MIQQDTIFAQATAQGYGALGMIRISGPGTFNGISKFFRFSDSAKNIDALQTHTIHFGHVFDNSGIIDEALLSIYRAPQSYTKEDSAEFTVHGSPYILKRIALALIDTGLRQAAPGEFTMRAFMNGRFDLSQAEAVADLISSHSDASHDLAFRQFRGEFSTRIKALRKELVDFTALIELELDFADEDVVFADRTRLLLLVNNLQNEIQVLLDSFAQGNVIKQGIPVTITGRPNAGKSTLLNLLLKDDKALVSEIPGTTRDSLEDVISIDGITFRFIDTAGLRKSDDVIENMGIERALQMTEKAEIVLYVADLSSITVTEIQDDIDDLGRKIAGFENKKLIVIFNKIDLLQEIPHGFQKYLQSDTIYISAKRGENITILEEMLKQTAINKKSDNGFVVSNTRHYEALLRTHQALGRVEKGMSEGISQDLLTSDLRDAMHYLGNITGEITNDDILNSVFSNFCIGK